ncbi:MAG: tetratricopeptide repeat protein, partial [bacterium]|nr:tetratricopeptide repeat protein [bacterium]
MMIVHKTLALELTETQTARLSGDYRDVVEHLENGSSLELKILENLKETLSRVIADSKEWRAILEEVHNSGDFYCLHLLHHDNHILNLPWSMAPDPVSGKPLGQLPQLYLTKGISTVSRGEAAPAAPAALVPAPLKVLVMIAAPMDARMKDRLSYEEEEREILEAFQPLMQSGLVQVDFTEEGSLEALERKLKENRFHILHVSGHGVFVEEDGKGYLQLEDPVSLKGVHVEAGAFAQAVNCNPRHRVPMVVLSSCQTAQGGLESGLGGVTDCLMRKDVPVVVSMGMSVSDHYAAMFTAALYRGMADKEPVFTAFHRAVQELREMEYRDLSEAGAEPAVPLQWIIPNLYLSRELEGVVDWGEPEEKLTFDSNRVIFDKDRLLLPHERDYLFIGRRREKAEILRPFFDRVPILLTGQGGVGKTAMAEHLVQRLAARKPDTSYFMFDEKNLSAKTILDALQESLEEKGELSMTELNLRETPIKKFKYLVGQMAKMSNPVFVLDNLENFQVEPGREFKETFAQVEEFIHYLCDGGYRKYHVILTCRYPVPGVKNLESLDLNQVDLTDFWKRALYLDVGHLHTYLSEAAVERERQGLPPGKTMVFTDVVRLLHGTFGGNYRALEFFNELVREEPGKIVDSLESMEAFRERSLDVTGEVRRRMGRNLLFSLLMGLLEPRRQGVLETLSHFRVPVMITALEMQDQEEGMDWEGMLGGLHRLTLIEVTTDPETGSVYYYVTPLVRDLLEVYNQEQKRPGSPFSHQQAGEYFYHTFHNIEKSVTLLEEAFYHFAESGDKEKVAEIGNELSHFYYKNSMYHNAFFYAHEAYRLLGDETGGVILNRLGLIYKLYGDYDNSLDLYKKTLAGYRKSGDKSGEGTTLNNMATIAHARGDYETAIKYLEQSLTLQREIGDKTDEGTTLNNISQIYDARGDYETAIKYLEQCLKLFQEIGDKTHEGGTLNQMSDMYEERGDLGTAR